MRLMTTLHHECSFKIKLQKGKKNEKKLLSHFLDMKINKKDDKVE